MPVKSVQISIDPDLLQRIDHDPEACESGRSAFLRSAASFYLAAKRRRGVDERIARAYEGQADAMLEEIAELMASQSPPCGLRPWTAGTAQRSQSQAPLRSQAMDSRGPEA